MLNQPCRFLQVLDEHGLALERAPLEIVQVNLGKLCNQACLHCHVEAGPKRTELMDARTTARIVELLEAAPSVHTLDITGGAPEMNPVFRQLVIQARKLGKRVIDRCNLTILFEEGYTDLPEFLSSHQVNIVASLPCYSRENLEKQRGKGTFDKSIQGLRRLNELGYGREDSSLELDLVYNPVGASLPPDQQQLEAAYKERLLEDFGITFNRLFTITNMPIKRFRHQLRQWDKLEEYMQLLLDSFNPAAAKNVMCRNLISISWTGELFDCDFNQMIELPPGGERKTIWDIASFSDLSKAGIATADHCFGCTAGAGSSCEGALS